MTVKEQQRHLGLQHLMDCKVDNPVQKSCKIRQRIDSSTVTNRFN